MTYKIKKDKVKYIKAKYKLQYISENTGITQGYISRIFSGKNCKKATAFSICKILDKNLEIEDLFDKVEK